MISDIIFEYYGNAGLSDHIGDGDVILSKVGNDCPVIPSFTVVKKSGHSNFLIKVDSREPVYWSTRL